MRRGAVTAAPLRPKYFFRILVRPEILLVVEDLVLYVLPFQQLQDIVLDIAIDRQITRVVDRGFDDPGGEHAAFEQLFPAHPGAVVLPVIGFELGEHRTEVGVINPE